MRLGVLAVAALLVGLTLSGCGSTTVKTVTAAAAPAQPQETATEKAATAARVRGEEAKQHKEEAKKHKEEAQQRHKEEAEKRAEEQKEAAQRRQEAAEAAETLSQKNAIKAAESYLSISGFSKAGLIEQLSSSAGSGFSNQDAVFAVDHLHVNWDEQAVRSAKDYLKTSSFSCQGLIEQLSSSAGSKYTQAQAEYAAKKVGLC
jgi:flagellar biosynthesis GTPase FlhF